MKLIFLISINGAVYGTVVSALSPHNEKVVGSRSGELIANSCECVR